MLSQVSRLVGGSSAQKGSIRSLSAVWSGFSESRVAGFATGGSVGAGEEEEEEDGYTLPPLEVDGVGEGPDGAEELAPPPFHANPYVGIGSAPFEESVASKLVAPLNEADVEIKPDGLLYLPEIKYRRVLNDAFGPGGWGMMPISEATLENGTVSREYALYALGRFVSQARGEQPFDDKGLGGGRGTGMMSVTTAEESAKSNALMRCCKDLGIASELWDPGYISGWKVGNAVAVWAENAKTGARRKLWRRKDRPPFEYPWTETGSADGPSPPPQSTSSGYSSGRISGGSGGGGGGGGGYEQYQETGGSGGGAPSGGDAPARAPPASWPDGVVDLDATVPPALKKMAGRTWRQVLSSPAGRSYLNWYTTNLTRSAAAKMATEAMDAFQAEQEHEG